MMLFHSNTVLGIITLMWHLQNAITNDIIDYNLFLQKSPQGGFPELNFNGIINASILFKEIGHSEFNIDETVVTITFFPKLSKQGRTQIERQIFADRPSPS
jgi:hypothetical protein